MDDLPHMFCARCKGILLGGYPNPKQLETVIAGKHFHYYCGGKELEEKLDKDIKKLDEKISERNKKYRL